MPANSAISLLVYVCLGGATLFGQSTNSATPQAAAASPATPDNAQTPAPAAATPAPTPPPPRTTFSASSVRLAGIDFSGIADGYYSFNNNHPDPNYSALYNFDDRTNQWDLNMLKLTASHDPDPIGFRLDIGLGRAFEVIHTPSPDPDFFRYVEQAFVSVKPKGWKGFEVDLGDFVTSAGAEVIESKDNWNYSRSILFAYAIPYYHFGLRTSMPIGNNFTVGVQVVNGWNSIVDTHGNNMKTVGITGAFTRKKYTWSHNYYVGPQYTSVNNRNRNLYDTTLLLTPNDKINAYLNFDYGRQNRPFSGADHWVGFAGALHFQLNKYFAISPRAEYFDDNTGFATGTAQKIHEFTLTGEYKVMAGLLARLEYRHDGSTMPFFYHGNMPSAKSQDTVTVGFIGFFPSKHQ